MRPTSDLFKFRQFPADIILWAVRWYLRYTLTYRDLEEIMTERGIATDHSTIYRWVQRYGSELDERCRRHLRLPNDSWHLDETFIKVRNALPRSSRNHFRLGRQLRDGIVTSGGLWTLLAILSTFY